MSEYNMVGLKNFIVDNYKSPLTTKNEYEVRVKGMETRYVDGLIFNNVERLANEVHNKVIDKLADKIADDVVDRILRQIDENKKEKEEKIPF